MKTRGQRGQGKKLSKERLLSLSVETIEKAMVQFIAKINHETLTETQVYQLKELYSDFVRIQESK